VQLALMRLRTAPPADVKELATELATDIELSAKSVDMMLRDILDIDRELRPEPQNISLHRLAEHTLDILHRLHPTSAIKFELNIATDLKAHADPEHIMRVLMNLADNGFEALGPSGLLRI